MAKSLPQLGTTGYDHLKNLLGILGKSDFHSKEEIEKEVEYFKEKESLRISGYKDDNDILTMLRRINAVSKNSKHLYYLTEEGRALYNALNNEKEYNELLFMLLLRYSERYSRFKEIINELNSRLKENRRRINRLEIQSEIADKKDTNSVISLLVGIGILKKEGTKEFSIEERFLTLYFDEILLREIRTYLEKHNGYRLEELLIEEISEILKLEESFVSEKIDKFIKENRLYREYEAGYPKIIY